MLEFTVEIWGVETSSSASVGQSILRICPSSWTDQWSPTSQFKIRLPKSDALKILVDSEISKIFSKFYSKAKSADQLNSVQFSRPWSVQRLRSLWSVLFGSLIRVVVEFPGEIGCVLRDIHRIIYRHNLSSIFDRSVISNFSKFMIRSVIPENFSFYLKTEVLKIRFEFARLPDLENSYYSWWKWCFQNIVHDLCRLIAVFCPRY